MVTSNQYSDEEVVKWLITTPNWSGFDYDTALQLWQSQSDEYRQMIVSQYSSAYSKGISPTDLTREDLESQGFYAFWDGTQLDMESGRLDAVTYYVPSLDYSGMTQQGIRESISTIYAVNERTGQVQVLDANTWTDATIMQQMGYGDSPTFNDVAEQVVLRAVRDLVGDTYKGGDPDIDRRLMAITQETLAGHFYSPREINLAIEQGKKAWQEPAVQTGKAMYRVGNHPVFMDYEMPFTSKGWEYFWDTEGSQMGYKAAMVEWNRRAEQWYKDLESQATQKGKAWYGGYGIDWDELTNTPILHAPPQTKPIKPKPEKQRIIKL